ncbi:unnamed protein product [Cyclocybe aegerita]|uniref:Nephrocystin 3-like N-terminal domain-containing protein n=1 Tax=Cyclocybe aegerita TaxID=1973307 RepID=A0A8S0XW84_CYCAE|nr:unnamed protein product [Cyclocybe aegerita]
MAPMFSRPQNVVFTGGSYTHIESTQRGFDILQKHVALGAVHDSGERFDPPRCHPNTRAAILEILLEWARSDTSTSFLQWLYGSAGAGKSAIAQTLAELCASENLLIGDFFFSRMASGRSTEKNLVSTLAYQLVLAIPEARPYVEATIEQDPMIFHRSIEVQFKKLIVNPLLNIPSSDIPLPRLIIIDGLDECQSPNIQCYIIDTLTKSLQNVPINLKIFIASRPEIHICDAFEGVSDHAIIERLDLSMHVDEANADIRCFLENSFQKIKLTHPLRRDIPPSWPSRDTIEKLIQKSSGQFIYASTVVKYSQSLRHLPTQRLKIVLGLGSAPANHSPYEQLDALYTHILENASDVESVLHVISVLEEHKSKFTNDLVPLTPPLLDEVLFRDPGGVRMCLIDVASLITYHLHDQPIHVAHASLIDFLLDRSRSGRFCISDRLASAQDAWTAIYMHMFQHLSLQAPDKYPLYSFLSRFYHAAYEEKHPYITLRSDTQVETSQEIVLRSKSLQGFAYEIPQMEHLLMAFSPFLDTLQHYVHTGPSDALSIYEAEFRVLQKYLKAVLSEYSKNSLLVKLLNVISAVSSLNQRKTTAFSRSLEWFPSYSPEPQKNLVLNDLDIKNLSAFWRPSRIRDIREDHRICSSYSLDFFIYFLKFCELSRTYEDFLSYIEATPPPFVARLLNPGIPRSAWMSSQAQLDRTRHRAALADSSRDPRSPSNIMPTEDDITAVQIILDSGFFQGTIVMIQLPSTRKKKQSRPFTFTALFSPGFFSNGSSETQILVFKPEDQLPLGLIRVLSQTDAKILSLLRKTQKLHSHATPFTGLADIFPDFLPSAANSAHRNGLTKTMMPEKNMDFECVRDPKGPHLSTTDPDILSESNSKLGDESISYVQDDVDHTIGDYGVSVSSGGFGTGEEASRRSQNTTSLSRYSKLADDQPGRLLYTTHPISSILWWIYCSVALTWMSLIRAFRSPA